MLCLIASVRPIAPTSGQRTLSEGHPLPPAQALSTIQIPYSRECERLRSSRCIESARPAYPVNTDLPARRCRYSPKTCGQLLARSRLSVFYPTRVLPREFSPRYLAPRAVDGGTCPFSRMYTTMFPLCSLLCVVFEEQHRAPRRLARFRARHLHNLAEVRIGQAVIWADAERERILQPFYQRSFVGHLL
jgi:hypothetical protein